jgi:hypothetical protein
MDTRWFGPSGWELFHLIAFRSPHPDDVLNLMKDVLPCKYCRASTTEYVQKHPLRPTGSDNSRGNPGKWLYEIHNMVNNKLRTQCADDPTVVNPGPDPAFEAVKAKYLSMKPNKVPGRDFLMSVAYVYPAQPEQTDMALQRTFMHALAKAYPFEELRTVFAEYVKAHEPALESQRVYTKWMYGLLKALSSKTGSRIPTYRGYSHHVAYYKSGCSKKSYHGKTCRKMRGGGYTKQRDHRRTHRISHRELLG